MTAKLNKTIDTTFTGVLFELSNSFATVISDILTAAAALISSSITTLHVWTSRTAQRNHLMQLDNHQLNDIGLNRSLVIKEASKPFWRS